jgi:hypothetical protein
MARIHALDHRGAGDERTLGARRPGGTAPPVVGPVPSDSGWSPTTPGVFSILVESDKGRPEGCHGSASSHGFFPFSAMGHLEHFCGTPGVYPLRIRFYLDSADKPRPTPFRPPTLSVLADFTPSAGTARQVAGVSDSTPRYDGPGWPLAPSFGEVFSASSSQGGRLSVVATLDDPDAATTVTNRDGVDCELVPCA